MDTIDWLMLKAVAEEKSLTQAAQRLNISQPSLTYRIKSLESEFGIKILDRDSRGVTYTAGGDLILSYALEMLARLDTLKVDVAAREEDVSGTVRVGVSTVFTKYYLAAILKKFAKAFPHVDVVLRTGSAMLEIPELLAADAVDVVIRRGDMPWAGRKHVLFDEPKGIVSAQPIEIDTLMESTWIQHPFTKPLGSDLELYRWWRGRCGFDADPRIIMVNSIEACLEFVSQGLGWAFLPKTHLKYKRQLSFHPLIWPDGRPIVHPTVLLYREKALELRSARCFIEFLLREYPGNASSPDYPPASNR